MLRGKEFVNGEGYSKRHLSSNDYYDKDKQIQGRWIGQACEFYGVEAGTPVRDEQFEALRQNQHAVTGDRITRRNNTMRSEWVVGRGGKLEQQEVANRREFYDFTMSAPKTFSVLAVTASDNRVREWHDRATKKAIAEMERMTGIRNPEDGDAQALTGRFCAAHYRHDANRNLEPQLHDHVVVFNMTPFKDKGHYAVEARIWMDRCRYLTAVYRDALAHEAREAGFDVSLDKYGAPQIAGLEDLVEVFSRRTTELETLVARAEELAGTKLSNGEVKTIVFASRGLDLAKFEKRWAKNRDTLEALKDLHSADAEADQLRRSLLDGFTKLVRDASDGGLKEITTDEVIAAQRELLNAEQGARLQSAKDTQPNPERTREIPSLDDCIEHAVSHCFERKSVVKDYDLLTAAIERGLGRNISLDALKQAAASRPDLIKGRAPELTTRAHLEREVDLIRWVNEGKGKGRTMAFEPHSRLSPFQQKAVQDILESNDRITVMMGRAGTGKTFSLKEVVAANEKAGHQVFVTAPSNGARDVLRGEGGPVFEGAESLQRFMASPSLKARLGKDDLIVLDEAGMASVEDLHGLLQFVQEKECRILLSGDTRQHSSVAAGDALHILLKRTDVRRAALFEIIRQKPDALDGQYLKAAKLFSQGRSTAGFAALDHANVIHEHKGKRRVDVLAEEIVKSLDEKQTVIAVNPSHRENDAVNGAVREWLTVKGTIHGERTVSAYRSLGWTIAERKNVQNVKAGHIIEVTRGDDKGAAFLVEKVDAQTVTATDAQGRTREFTKSHAGMFDVCEPHELKVSVGDRLVTRAGVRSPKGEIINGERITVQGFDEQGNVLSEKGKLITTKNLAHAYAMTSHKSQGDTADTVLFGLDRHSIRWADQKLAYVAATRGRTQIKVFVENKADLTGLQTRDGTRKAATDLEVKEYQGDDVAVRQLLDDLERIQATRQEHEPERTIAA